MTNSRWRNAPNVDMNLRLDYCSHDAALYAVEHWHYSRRIPKGKIIKIGVWEDDVFKGAILFGWGATSTLVQQYGLKQNQGCELVRIALRDHVTPVSRLISIAIKMLKKQNPGLQLIVSFADPEQGHVGGIYQASGWIYTGKSPDYKAPILDGRVAHPRTLSMRVKLGKARRSEVQYIDVKGKLRYLYPLNDEMRMKVLPLKLPYPKKEIACEVNGVT